MGGWWIVRYKPSLIFVFPVNYDHTCVVFKFVVIFRTLGIISKLNLMSILYSNAFIVPKYIFLMTVYFIPVNGKVVLFRDVTLS